MRERDEIEAMLPLKPAKCRQRKPIPVQDLSKDEMVEVVSGSVDEMLSTIPATDSAQLIAGLEQFRQSGRQFCVAISESWQQ